MNNSVQIKTEKGRTSLTSLIEIDAKKSDVWDILKLPGKVDQFHPLIKKSFMTTEAQNGIGAKRHCDLLPMGQMDEIITEWDEGNAFTIKVTGGKMLPPHQFMQGRFELKEMGGDKTKVTFTFSYRLKYGALGRIMDALLIRPQFKQAPPKYVEGLKRYVEARRN